MKRVLFLLIVILTISTVKAQDLIVMKDASEIQAKVSAVTNDSITYKRWSNLDGPTYTISKANVFYIKYANGEKDAMQSMSDAQNNNLQSSTPKWQNRPLKNKTNALTPLKFEGYATAGTIFTANGAGPTLDISVGMKIYEYLYVGIQTGFHSLFSEGYHYRYGYGYEDYFEAYVPVALNLKGYITRGRKVNPYINCTLGGFFGICDLYTNGFLCQVGAGIDVKRFTFGIGYNGLVKEGTASCGYVQLGVRFGKN